MDGLASGSWLTRQRVSAVAAISGAIAVAMLLFLLIGGRGTLDPFGQPVGVDFTAFWHAGRLANAGDAARAWEPAALNAAVRATHGTSFAIAWLYPPPFLLVAAPLASLPYVPALIAWQALSLALIAVTLRAILPDRRATLVALASPITPMVLAHGQTAFLTAALLSSGLHLLNKRPVAAGSLFGALIYKPQFAVLLAPALLLGRNWKTIAAAIVSTVALAAFSFVLWGFASWEAFATSLRLSQVYMEQGAVGFHKSASLFSAARMWGASVTLGYAVQAIGLAAALALIWRLRAAEPALLAAGLCAATALSTPYLLDYDMATVAVGGAFLYAVGARTGFRPYERSILAYIWAVPWFSRDAAALTGLPLAQLSMIFLAALAWRRSGIKASPSRRSRGASAR